MLVAILSDIHANLEALESVIKDLEMKIPDAVICLGDLTGYGPDPEEVVKRVRENDFISVIGNHEAAFKDNTMRKWLNFQAEENSITTEQLLSEESLHFCCTLPRSYVLEDALFVHGFPPDSVSGYVTMKSDKQLEKFFKNTDKQLFFVGHSHELMIICWDGNKITKTTMATQEYNLKDGCKYLINAGSVGQPRDGDNRAKYILWNTELQSIEVIGVPYDIKKTSEKILQRGFPEAYASRLW